MSIIEKGLRAKLRFNVTGSNSIEDLYELIKKNQREPSENTSNKSFFEGY